jgi:hypothetical protein
MINWETLRNFLKLDEEEIEARMIEEYTPKDYEE